MNYREFDKELLTVRENDEQREYFRRSNVNKIAVPWGQRKLMLIEIEFLSLYWKREEVKKPKIIYAGAAPGKHIEYLAELFPECEFFLWDPMPFHLKAQENIHIYQEYFTDEIAHKWANRNDVFFISDIRTANYKTMTETENENQIITDMNHQRNWHEIMKPIHSLLKFRLPYSIPSAPQELEYLDGILYRQPWAPQTSTETRLVPFTQGQTRKWNCLVYEKMLFHFNTIIRETHQYLNPFTLTPDPINPPELLNDYDSLAEVTILSLYLQSRNLPITPVTISNLSQAITDAINKDKPFVDSLSLFRKDTKLIKNRNANKSSQHFHSK